MRSRFSTTALIAGLALISALVLTILRPSPEGLMRLGVGEQEVRAAPGAPTPKVSKHNLTGLKVFNVTLVRIRDAYVDPSRISPKEMLYAALDSVQFDIPEVLVEPYRDRDEVVVQVNDKRQTFSTSEVDSPWRLAGKLKRVFRFIEANMNPGADLAEVEYSAVNGMLRTLDPHSVLLDPETAREMDVSTSGKFGGLGIVIRMRDRKLTIVRPMKDTPAWTAGLKAGDYIYKINDEITENLTLNEAVSRMRGDPGTPIVLWIKRKGQTNAVRYEITRDIIRVESVDSQLLDGGVGYIRLKQFSGRSAREVKDAVAELKKKGAKGFILDLRGNPGGLLEQAIQIADQFVDSGTIVTTVGGRERDPRRAKRKGTDSKSPLVVLVNGSSASASEIVAGALKNLNRALIVGTTTFGKGSVQILYDNNDGSKLKLTIAQYLTPGDRSIQSVGIAPDIDLERMFVSDTNQKPGDGVRLLRSSHGFHERDLESHLTSRYARGADKPAYELPFLYEPPKDPNAAPDDASALPDDEDASADDLDDSFVMDFEIGLARDLVASATSATRKGMIKGAKSIVQKTRAEQQAKLTAALSKLGVDWSATPQGVAGGAKLQAEIKLDPSGTVHSGDTVKILGTVTNSGTAPAYQAFAQIKADDRVFDETELVFGKVNPGQTRTWTSYVKVPEDAPDRIDQLSFHIRDAGGQTADAQPIKLRVQAAERPVFAYSYQLIDEGNGDGLVQKGETHHLRVEIKNIGKGTAGETTALLRNTSGDGVLVKKGRFELGKLDPGKTATVNFVWNVTNDLKSDDAVLEMTVYDSVLHESVTEKLDYPVHDPSAGPARASGSVAVRKNGAAVREGASDASNVVGWAKRGSVFKVTGKEGGWYRVDLGDHRPGFLTAGDVTRASASAHPTTRPNWQVTPPTLSLNVPSLETSGDHYSLSGVATDDTHIEDVYVFVSNADAKVDNKKVFYKSNRGAKNSDKMSFTSNIPLWPGSNRVTVVVRENDDVRSLKTLYLYRKDGSDGIATNTKAK